MRRAAGIHGGPALWDVDGDAIAQRVERLAWVESVDVERNFPKQVTVKVHEYEAAAVAVAGPRLALIAANGRVLELVSANEGGLAQIDIGDRVLSPGVAIAHSEIAMVAARLPAALRAQGARVDARDPDAIVVMVGAVEVRLGRADQVDRKLAAAVAVLNVEEACRSYIDVSVPLAPVSGCATKR